MTTELNRMIAPWCNFSRNDPDGTPCATSTRLVRIDREIHKEIPSLLATLLPHDPAPHVALLCDANTRAVAGEALQRSFAQRGQSHTLIELHPVDGHEVLTCDEHLIARAVDALRLAGANHVLAVGSGTLNDTAKAAAEQLDCDCSVYATAPSMNGYTSSIAAILSDGVKITRPSRSPLAVFADPEIMAEAPYRMIASGIGDLYSKPVSNADWRLSARLLGTRHSPIVMEIVEAGNALLDGVAPRLPSRDRDAVARLTAALMLSGLAMQAAGTSGPASGGEHLVSHYIDMTAHAFGLSHDFHGCQVAVGTIATCALYQRLKALDPASIDVDACVSAHLDLAATESRVRERFGTLADAVLPHTRKSWTDADSLRERLTTLKARWTDIWDDVSSTLRTPDDLEAELRSAHCPTRFHEIDVDPQRARQAIAWSMDIRARYTVLHLGAELGQLERFAEDYVDASRPVSS